VVLAVRGHASDVLQPTGALDPSVRDNSAPRPVQPAAEKALLDRAISENVIAHSRELCPNGRGLQQNETAIAAAGNVVVVAFNDARGGPSACPDDHAASGWGYSLDGGATFTDGGALPHPRDFNNGDPWLGVSPDGQTFYFSGLWRGFAGFGFLRGRAIEGGFVWDEPVIISFPSTGAFMDKEAFVVDPNDGTIYLTYTDFRAPTGIKLTRSRDGGDTWLDPVMVNPGGQGSFPAVDNQGILYVAYNTAGVSGPIGVSRSLDGGDTFERVVTFPVRWQGVAFMDRSPAFPQLAVDVTRGTRDGWAYVVWHMLDEQNVLRPYISHSEDGGSNWTTPIPMDSDVNTTAFHWWPSVSVDSTGNVNAIWLDRRLNPGTGLTDTFFAQSTDGGNTFTDVRMSDVSGNWQGIRYDGGFTFAGDYIRAVSVGTTVYAAWTDARNGDPDIYFARVDAAAMAGRKQ
jgi:hypothetical protein